VCIKEFLHTTRSVCILFYLPLQINGSKKPSGWNDEKLIQEALKRLYVILIQKNIRIKWERSSAIAGLRDSDNFNKARLITDPNQTFQVPSPDKQWPQGCKADKSYENKKGDQKVTIGGDNKAIVDRIADAMTHPMQYSKHRQEYLLHLNLKEFVDY